MRKLLKRSFEFFNRKRRLKKIDKECERYIKMKIKLAHQQCIVDFLFAEYKKKYGEDLCTTKNDEVRE